MKTCFALPAIVTHTLILTSLMLFEETCGGSVSPVSRNDVIGREKMNNREQCRRLCWYRRLCTSYSYCSTCRGGINCLLHSAQTEDNGAAEPSEDPSWTEEDALEAGTIGNTCRQRTCGDKEVCLPTADGSHHCRYKPAHCHLHDSPPGAVLRGEGGGREEVKEQGQVVDVECLPDFVLVPADADVRVRCQVNSKWTTFQGKCVQVNFTHPEMPFSAPLPWGVSDGWGLCVRGVFINSTVPPSSSISRIMLGMNCPHEETLPFQNGDTFSYGIKLNLPVLRFDIHGRQNYTFDIPTDGSSGQEVIHVEDIKIVHVTHSLKLTYVNIMKDCRDL
ncbi:uncharacterized protein LOC143297103 [Babylonia areolata]|uniref:uncharacterized protein LOC143297103 n=1 Tax=Babylonia areolata TaxID=304850 RepID=UPI003FD693A9